MSSASTRPYDASAPPPAAPSVLWRGKPMQPRTWSRLWKREPWIRHLSGLTSAPSALSRGVDAWIASLEATPASLSASPGKAKALQTPATCGPTSPASSPSASPPCASSKTSPTILDTASMKSPATSKKWVSTLRRHCGQRRKQALLTAARGSSSLLPTPTAAAYGSSQNGQRPDGTTYSQAGKPILQTMARNVTWPTPMARDHKSGRGPASAARNSPNLPAAVLQAERPAGHAVKPWPTPTASLGTNGGRVTPSKAREGGTLTEALSARTEWATPTVKGNYARPRPSNPKEGSGLATQVGGQLNPQWVGALMGWPHSWTAAATREK